MAGEARSTYLSWLGAMVRILVLVSSFCFVLPSQIVVDETEMEWKQREVVKYDCGNIAPLILGTYPSKSCKGRVEKQSLNPISSSQDS